MPDRLDRGASEWEHAYSMSASEEPSVRKFQINLENSSWIEGRGVRHSEWSVRVNDAWIPVRDLRDVGSTMADPHFAFEEDDEFRVLPAGCQYRITFHPCLPIGTQLLKRVSVPRELPRRAARAEPVTQEDALRAVLAAFPPLKTPLQTTLTEYRVVGHNKYVTEATWQRAGLNETQRRKAPVRDRAVSVQEMEAFRDRLSSELSGAKVG
jgi:hypothetical protein